MLASQSRRHEKRIPFERVKANLIKSGRLRGAGTQRRVDVKCGERTQEAVRPLIERTDNPKAPERNASAEDSLEIRLHGG